eukprot:gene12058-14746_t
MSQFPVSPRDSKMLLIGKQHKCLPYIISIVAILTVKDPFVNEGYEMEDESMKLDNDADMDESEKEKLAKEKEKRQKELQRIRNSQRKWIHKESDLLTILKVVGAYDFQMKRSPKEIESFCKSQYLNPKSMSEIYKLRQQLTEIVHSLLSQIKEEDDDFEIDNFTMSSNQPMTPPNAKQELFIKQVITAGLIDHVARVKESSEYTPKNLTEYQPCSTNQSAFIHPTSTLFKDPSEFVVYCDIIETKRPYMKMVTEINPSWLPLLGGPLCSEFKPLETPPPHYSVKHDRVRCCIKPNFGQHNWELPLIKIDHPDPLESIRYFAKALLEGQVFTPLKYLVPYLNSNSTVIVQPNTQSKVYRLIQSLKKSGNISTKEKLFQVWLKNPSFLLEEYSLWLDKSFLSQNILKHMWPPLDNCKIPLSLIK